MYNIHIIFTRHGPFGNCNADKLFKIIEKLKPEVREALLFKFPCILSGSNSGYFRNRRDQKVYDHSVGFDDQADVKEAQEQIKGSDADSA